MGEDYRFNTLLTLFTLPLTQRGYLRDKILDEEVYSDLANNAEALLIKRMTGTRPALDQARGDPGFDPHEHRAAIDALCSGKLPHMALIDLAELAHCNRHIIHNGSEWETVYDLVRIQILRRIQRFRLLGKNMARVSRPQDAIQRLTASGSNERDFSNLGWLDDEWEDEQLAAIEGGELGLAREELRLAETLFSPNLPDDVLLRLYLFVMRHGDDEPGIWSPIRGKTKRLILSRLTGGPKERRAEYKAGFDPKDHQFAIEAISKNALT